MRLESSGTVDRAAELRWIEALSARWSTSRRFRVDPSGRPVAIALLDPARPVWLWLDGGGGVWICSARVTWTRADEPGMSSVPAGGTRLEARGPSPSDVERELQRQLVGAFEADLRRWFPVRGTVTGLAADGVWRLGDARDGAWEAGMVLTIAASDGLARLRVRDDGLAEAIARPGDWHAGLDVLEARETAEATSVWAALSLSGTFGCELSWGHALPGWAPAVGVEGREGVGLSVLARNSRELCGGWAAWEVGGIARLEGPPGAPRQALDARLGLSWMYELGGSAWWGRGRIRVDMPLATSGPGHVGAITPDLGIGVAF